MVTWIIRQLISPPLHVYKLRTRTFRSRTGHSTIHLTSHFVSCTLLLTEVFAGAVRAVAEACGSCSQQNVYQGVCLTVYRTKSRNQFGLLCEQLRNEPQAFSDSQRTFIGCQGILAAPLLLSLKVSRPNTHTRYMEGKVRFA
jgi:hypothetical protein